MLYCFGDFTSCHEFVRDNRFIHWQLFGYDGLKLYSIELAIYKVNYFVPNGEKCVEKLS